MRSTGVSARPEALSGLTRSAALAESTAWARLVACRWRLAILRSRVFNSFVSASASFLVRLEPSFSLYRLLRKRRHDLVQTGDTGSERLNTRGQTIQPGVNSAVHSGIMSGFVNRHRIDGLESSGLRIVC